MYDGIQNSVFSSQVLEPLLARLTKDKSLEITLISFEKEEISVHELLQRIPACDRLHLIIGKKLPFFGRWTLLFAAYQLKCILQRLSFDHILARGPLAGFITLWALEKNSKKLSQDFIDDMPEVTIQARGLCAEEYRYEKHSRPKKKLVGFKNPVQDLIYRFMYNSLKNIEFLVYNKANSENVTIEAVSPALKEYLIQIFHTQASHITIAQNDIPQKISPEQISLWRQEIREKLHIPEDFLVYTYCGSYKPWQCAPETVIYFSEQLKDNKKIFFLILSPDKNKFLEACEKQNIDKKYYTVLNLPARDVYKYLAVGDYGFLFREQDIVNWVSRPTKMLEYQAVGLKIIHNNTIAWLNEKTPHSPMIPG